MTEKTRKTSLPVREVGHRRLEDYAAVTGPGPVEEIRELAAGLKGKSVPAPQLLGERRGCR